MRSLIVAALVAVWIVAPSANDSLVRVCSGFKPLALLYSLISFDVAEFRSGSDPKVCACVGLAEFVNSQALNMVVGVDSSRDLEPQNVRVMVSQHGLVAGSAVFNPVTESQS